MSAALLSDSWHQVAEAQVALLPTVQATPQRFRGRPWVVLEDPYSHRFFRVTPQAYGFLRALNADETVDAVWQRVAQQQPEGVPTQDEVLALLSQLHLASLLYFRAAPQSSAILDRVQATRRRELLGKLMAFLFVRIPLFSPDRALDAVLPLIRATTGPVAGLVWLVVVLAGAWAVVGEWPALSAAGQGLLSLSNLPVLYAAIAIVKVIHELAHAFVCKRYGGQVPVFGVMLLVLAPLPYTDATASWAMRSKWQRAYVGAAGMLSELFVAALAAMVWVNTGDGPLHSLAFNMMVVGSVSSLLFNGNPLLRFDAYYILSDLAELPNLYQKAQAQWLHWGRRFILGEADSREPALDGAERTWYGIYGALAFFYRLLVTVTILLFVTDQWFAVGVLLLVTTFIAMLALPLTKFGRHLAGLRRGQARAWAGAGASVALLWGGLALLPLPHAVRLPGVLEAQASAPLYVQTAGVLEALPVRHGQRIAKGTLIARLDNPDLRHALQTVALQQSEVQALQRQALLSAPAEVGPLQGRLDALRERERELRTLAAQLEVRAPHDGEWVAPALHEREGGWIERGQPLGELIDRSRFRFSAVLPQSQVAELIGVADAGSGSLRLMHARTTDVPVARLRLVPYQRQRLPSAVLGFGGGGDVAVRPEDQSGTLTTEPFFELLAEPADPALAGLVAYHGLSGVLRVPVPARPLWQRASASLKQLLQQRYQVQP
jgi:putative peptide zinc metalloprotease protein